MDYKIHVTNKMVPKGLLEILSSLDLNIKNDRKEEEKFKII